MGDSPTLPITRLAVTLLGFIVVCLAGLAALLVLVVRINTITEKMEDCFTPGPRVPAADDVDRTTGHPCYDQIEGNRDRAVAKIIDADQDGQLDIQEILDRLDQP